MLRTVFAAIAIAIAAAAVMFGLAGLWTGVLVRDFIAANVSPTMLRNPPNLLLVFFGYAALAVLMAMIYRKFVPVTASPARSGLRFGLASAVCWLMPYSLVLFGVYNFPYVVLPLDFAWAMLEQGIGGLVIGLIYGKTPGNE
jgi:hypothetical protein